jgi:hypothetical protein
MLKSIKRHLGLIPGKRHGERSGNWVGRDGKIVPPRQKGESEKEYRARCHRAFYGGKQDG